MSKAEILELLPKLGSVDRREILDHLCALEEAETSDSDQRLVMKHSEADRLDRPLVRIGRVPSNVG